MKQFGEAAYGVVTQPSSQYTGEHFYDEEILDMLGVSTDQFKKIEDRKTETHYKQTAGNRNGEINYNRASEKSAEYDDLLVD